MKYHSTVSKGTFMRMLGLGGANPEVAPSALHDLDEVTASPVAECRRPWWSVSTVGCSTCFAVCPFSKKDKSFMHRTVKATISANPLMTGLINGVLTRMDALFGYQRERELESWWNLNLPSDGTNDVKGTQLE